MTEPNYDIRDRSARARFSDIATFMRAPRKEISSDIDIGLVGVLDPEMIKEVLDTMVGLAEEGMTMLCVTHEMGFARKVANRVIFMDQGQIVEQNSPDEFFEDPQHNRTKLFLSQMLH